MALSIGYRRIGDISVIAPEGYIDTSTAGELEEAIKKQLDEGAVKLIIDLGGVEFVSSAGWGIFVAYLKRARTKGGDIKLSSLTEKVDKVFKLMEFDSLIDAFEDAEAAAKNF